MTETVEARPDGGLAQALAEGGADALVEILRGPEEWISNRQIMDALGYKKGIRPVTPMWFKYVESLGEEHSVIMKTLDARGQQRVAVRYFSKKAAILIALRVHTEAAAVFRMWLADRVVKSILQEAGDVTS